MSLENTSGAIASRCRPLLSAWPAGLVPLGLAMLLAACATPPQAAGPEARGSGAATMPGPALSPASGPPGLPRIVHAVTASNELIRLDAARPERLLERRSLSGLAPGETIVGIDYRVARGMLYALGSTGRLYVVDPRTAQTRAVGEPALPAVALSGRVGFDFNPTVDRIRVVTDAGLNARLHPDTGALVDSDPVRAGAQPDGPLAFDPRDRSAGAAPAVVAAAYTYNQQDERLTTNFAIDAARGLLLTQGTRENAATPVSPNTGALLTVGPLGTGPLEDVSFDIADIDNEALASVRQQGRSVLMRIDLLNGRASPIGTIGDGSPVRGIAIEP